MQNSDCDGPSEGCQSGYRQTELLCKGQIGRDALGHDGPNAVLQIGPSYARDAGQRRSDVEFADIEDAFGVAFGIAGGKEHGFVAGALAFIDETLADPPDQRMEPEDGFDGPVDGSGRVVAAADVAEPMGEDRLPLFGSEAVGDALGNQQDGPEHPEDARFETGWRG